MISSECRPGVPRRAAWLCAAVLVVVWYLPAGAQPVYTWTDGSGTVHFSDSPPPAGQKYEQRGAVPLEPPVRQGSEGSVTSETESSGTGSTTAGGTDSQADAGAKKTARVILTSKEASPRGPETRHVIGSVKNVGGAAAGSVGVTVTIVDSNGTECSREEMEVVPPTLESGDIGNFDGTINSPCFADGGTVDAEAHWN